MGIQAATWAYIYAYKFKHNHMEVPTDNSYLFAQSNFLSIFAQIFTHTQTLLHLLVQGHAYTAYIEYNQITHSAFSI